MDKKTLRKFYKDKRSKLTAEEISEWSLDVSDLIIQSFELNNKYVHVFLPIFDKKEVNTWLTVDRLMSVSKVVVSRSDFDTYRMEHVLLENDVAIETSDWGIPEPVGGNKVNVKDLDVVIVPLLAYNKEGYRIGYGKGFYDRFLSELPSKTITIGLSFFDPEEKIEDINEFDKQLDYCVTPNKLYTFKK